MKTTTWYMITPRAKEITEVRVTKETKMLVYIDEGGINPHAAHKHTRFEDYYPRYEDALAQLQKYAKTNVESAEREYMRAKEQLDAVEALFV